MKAPSVNSRTSVTKLCLPQVSKCRSPSSHVLPPGLRSARATRAEDVHAANLLLHIIQNCNILPMYEQAREILNSCMSKFGQDGWLSLRSDCGQMLQQLSFATLDTVTMVQVGIISIYFTVPDHLCSIFMTTQVSLLLMHPEVALPMERKTQLEEAVSALLNGKPSMGLQPMQVPLIMQIDQHHRLLRCSCSWENCSRIVEESGLLHLRVISTCSVLPLAASSLFVDMNPPNLSFTVTHAAGARGLRVVEYKDALAEVKKGSKETRCAQQ